MNKDQQSIKKQIEKAALNVGFDVVRFTAPTGLEANAAYFNDFIKKSRHGQMKWMEQKVDRRNSPLTLWPDTKTIIMLGMNYGPDHDPLINLKQKNKANISVYAKGRDYHDVVKKRLKQIARQIHQDHNVEVKVFVDTAPVMEKPLAEKSGIGWIGKHTNLVSRDFGSWLFLGSIFTTLQLETDEPEKNHCGSCIDCLNICPTNAFPSPYQLDARRCISYLTIEYKGHIDLEFRKAMGNRIYGCDDCLSVCPWNKYAKKATEEQYFPRQELDQAKLDQFATLDDSAFRKLFSGSPIKRIGRDYFIRNVLIAVGNSDNKEHIPLLITKLDEPNPHIRAMAVWAIKELTGKSQFETFKNKYLKIENDPSVIQEWTFQE